MNYLNKSFSVGGPLKGVTDKDYAAIWARKCEGCGKPCPFEARAVEEFVDDNNTSGVWHAMCWARKYQGRLYKNNKGTK